MFQVHCGYLIWGSGQRRRCGKSPATEIVATQAAPRPHPRPRVGRPLGPRLCIETLWGLLAPRAPVSAFWTASPYFLATSCGISANILVTSVMTLRGQRLFGDSRFAWHCAECALCVVCASGNWSFEPFALQSVLEPLERSFLLVFVCLFTSLHRSGCPPPPIHRFGCQAVPTIMAGNKLSYVDVKECSWVRTVVEP